MDVLVAYGQQRRLALDEFLKVLYIRKGVSHIPVMRAAANAYFAPKRVQDHMNTDLCCALLTCAN